ncbi:MAG TPA: NAD-dependent epimerase/dehydratase family protein [Vicinamibacterales bacterium]|nr:NAD-dependent epimerase/dehydratase family protein [Vicinamibacterales bacterium]
MISSWAGKRVLVTGGAGFVGRAVVAALYSRGVTAADVVVPRSRDCDLRIAEHAYRAARRCDVVFHLAAPTGNIEFSRAHPASQYRDCSRINVNVFEAARQAGVKRLVSLGNLLAYSPSVPAPFVEDRVREGEVAPDHAGIALAKRQLLDLAPLYHREFGLDAVTVLGANAYGPHDHFAGAQAHVIPSLITKCLRDEDLQVWGDGTAVRDFLYVDDLADGMLLAAERLPAASVINIASGSGVAIGELVRIIAGLCGFKRRILFDASRSGGDMRRVASTERARALLGFAPRVPLEDGLRRTIEWYRQSPVSAAAP